MNLFNLGKIISLHCYPSQAVSSSSNKAAAQLELTDDVASRYKMRSYYSPIRNLYLDFHFPISHSCGYFLDQNDKLLRTTEPRLHRFSPHLENMTASSIKCSVAFLESRRRHEANEKSVKFLFSFYVHFILMFVNCRS